MKQRRHLNPSSRKKTPVIAVAGTLALIAAGTFGGNEILKTQEIGSANVQVSTSTASLADATSVIVDDPAVATQGEGDEARTVKEFVRDEEFSVFGLTWEGDRDIAAFVRAERPDGTWSEWYEMDAEVGPDGVANGTEPIYVEKTKRVQVSTANVDLVAHDAPAEDAPADMPAESPAESPVDAATKEAIDTADSALPDSSPVDLSGFPSGTGPSVLGDRALPTNYGEIAPVADVEELADEPAEGNAESAPVTTAADLDAVFIEGGEGTLDGEIAPAQYNTSGMPRVVSRSSWGAGKSRTPYYSEPTKAITIHHTAGSNNYTAAQAPGIVRGIWAYHANNLGWGDIGYNALVDKYGTIYEGRAGGLDRNPQGAHVGSFNAHTWGISMMGDYQQAQPTKAALNAIGEMIGWKAGTTGIDPTGKVWLTSDANFRGSKYSRGQGANFNVINAHRDFHFSTCPGDNLYGQMGYIRNVAKAKADAVKNNRGYTPPASQPQVNTPAPSQTTPPTNTGTVTNNDGTTTTINNLANTSSKVSFEGIMNGDPAAIAAAVGTVGGAVLLFAAGNGMLPKQVTNVANTEILPGLTLTALRPYVGKVINTVGSPETKQTWSQLEPVLGQLSGVLQGVGGDEYGIFEKGIALLSADGNQVIMPEKIANAWLQQGLDLGPLGKPVKSEGAASNGDVRVDFARGSITYHAATGNLDVSVN